MDLPFLEVAKKKQQEKKRRIMRIVILVLFLLIIGIFGGLYYFWKKENLSLNSTNTKAGTMETSKGPITLAPAGPTFAAIKFDSWTPSIFKDKLVYCDSNYQIHAKTNIDASKIIAADRFSQDRARILLKTGGTNTAYVYIDRSGKQVIGIHPEREYCGPFSEGLACFEDKLSGKIGFMDKQGKVVISPQFAVSVFTSGNTVHKQSQLDNSLFSDGLAAVYNSNVNSNEPKAACGYINHAGKYVIPVSFLEACPFVAQRARVLVKDNSKWKRRWGYIDKKGKFVLKPIHMEELDFSEGLAAVLDYTGKWGYIDKTGAYKIPARFAGASSFSEGIAAASISESRAIPNWGYITKDGSWLVEPMFDRADPFHEGIAYACNGCEDKSAKANEEFSVNAQGKVEKFNRTTQIELKLPELSGPHSRAK